MTLDSLRNGADNLVPRPLLRVLRALLWLELAGGVALFLVVAVKTLLYAHEVIVSEAAIGLAVRSVLDGVPFYSPVRWTAEPFVIVHYTPLYYVTTAVVSKIVGGGLFFPGRLVSILCTIATGFVAAAIARRATGRTVPALAAGALWLSFYQVVFWGTTQRVDALGILFEGLGVLAFAWARMNGRIGYRALPWFVAAWATKQVMIAGLLAAVVVLFLQDGTKRAVRFAVAGFGTIVLLAGALTAWSHGGFWTATVLGTVSSKADTPWVVFSNAELFFGSPWNMVMLAASTWAAWVIGGAAARRGGTEVPVSASDAQADVPGRRLNAASASSAPQRMGSLQRSGSEAGESVAQDRLGGLALLLGIYLWIGLLLAIATDANLPRFFPPMLAMALLVALLIDRGRCAPRLAAGLSVVLVLTGASHGLYEMRSLVRERIVNLHEGNERLLFARAVERHTGQGALVLAQDAGMVLSADRSPVVADPYVFSILAGNSAWRPDLLEQGIRAHRYGAVVLNRPLESLDPEEWTTLWISPAKTALLENYRLAETVTIDQEWRFLEPTRYIYVPVDQDPEELGAMGGVE